MPRQSNPPMVCANYWRVIAKNREGKFSIEVGDFRNRMNAEEAAVGLLKLHEELDDIRIILVPISADELAEQNLRAGMIAETES